MNAQGQPRHSLAYAWYVVAVLMVAYVFSFIDRQILNLLVGPIRADLGISDTQMSLLMGFSFALFYTICGIPLGRLADSKSRRTIIAAGIFFWSLMTAACGTAKSYWQFFLYRMGVGVGEATLSPSAYSLIADYFPKESRATAISVYSMGIYIGSGLAFLLGGLVIQFAGQDDVLLPLVGATRPWQLIFFILGIAGILFAFAMYTVREPARQGLSGATAGVPLGTVFAYMKQNRRAVLCHNFGFALMAFTAYGAAAWVPTFFIRHHGWTAAQIGVAYGTVIMIFGTFGIVAGGRLSDWLARRGHEDANMRVGLLAAVCGIPSGIAFPLVPDANLAVAMVAISTVFLSMPFGVAPAAVQEMMPNDMRGQASAVYLFVVNLIGLGVGPTAVALATDYVFRNDAAVGYSLLLVGSVAQAGALLLLWAGLAPYRRTLANLRDWLDSRRGAASA
ncbi:MAG TPA: MFS transporter [Nevskiales bacterium]|nr:MFS transporter [Nevskiales bacterium]